MMIVHYCIKIKQTIFTPASKKQKFNGNWCEKETKEKTDHSVGFKYEKENVLSELVSL